MTTTIDGSSGLTFPDATTQATAAVSLGVGQTWQDVTASRAPNTTYTNSTGKPIAFVAKISFTSGAVTCTTIVGGVTLHSASYTSTVYYSNLSASPSTVPASAVLIIVPPGGTYSVNTNGASPVTAQWLELR